MNRPGFDAASFLAKDAYHAEGVPDGSARPGPADAPGTTGLPSPWAAAQALGPKLGVGPETLRKWIVQAQVDGGARPGPSSEELTEIKALKSQVRDLTEANEILKAASVLKLDADAVVDRPSGGVEAENLACRLESGSPVDESITCRWMPPA